MMELLVKRDAPYTDLSKDINLDEHTKINMLRSKLNISEEERKKFKKLYKESKDELEEQIIKNNEQTELLKDVKRKKREYHRMYISEKEVADKMGSLYEDTDAKLNDTLKGNEGWMPLADFNKMKTQC